MKRLVKAVTSGIAIILLVAGTPVALVLWGKLNYLVSLDWRHLFTRPDDGAFLLGVLTLIGWAAWASVTCSLVTQAVGQLRHRPVTFRLPGTAWFAPAATALIGAVAALGAVAASTSAGASLSAGTSQGVVSHVAFSPGTLVGDSTVGTSPNASSDASVSLISDGVTASREQTMTPTSLGSAVPQTSQGSPSTATEQAYRVKPGDDLWTLAETHLGSGARWGEIVAANDSSLLDPLAELSAGSVLMLPVDLVTPTVPAAEQRPSIKVQAGDTLWDLADAHLGDAHQWPQLHEANLDTVANPDLIHPGQELRLPTTVVTTGPADRETDTPPASGSDTNDADVDNPPDAAADDPSDADINADVDNPSDADINVDADTQVNADSDNEQDSEVIDAANSMSTAERILAIIGPLGAAAAAGVLLASQTRRATQMHERALGRSVPSLDDAITRFETALTMDAATEALPEPSDENVRAYVVLGVSDDGAGQQVELDHANAGVVRVYGDKEACVGLVGAITAQLLESCAQSRSEMNCVIGQHEWLGDLDDGLIHWFDDDEALFAEATREATERLAHLQQNETVVDKQLDPNCEAAWMPHFFVMSPASPVFESHVDFAAAGITLLTPGEEPQASSNCSIEVGADRASVVRPYNQRFVANVLTPEVEDRLSAYASASSSVSSDPAPWWDDSVPDAPDDLLEASPALSVTLEDISAAFAGSPDPLYSPDGALLLPSNPSLARSYTTPTLLVLGEVSLAGCNGKLPEKAVQQCIEYTGWLLQHPNATSVEMADSLLVAEGTRRSNMSRLRAWLGDAPDGQPCLPEAYSGRMRLHPAVTSDWNQFESFITGGVNKVSSASLIRALSLVRGAPLQEAPQGLWGWANNWRNHMVGAVRDAAVVLGTRALESGQYPLAQWALERGELVASHDDLLTMVKLRLEHALGHREEVDQIVLTTVRHSRDMNYDIAPELLQTISYVTRPSRDVAPSSS